ncbi:MAG: YciI family protein [Gemmatimonadota bacterium]
MKYLCLIYLDEQQMDAMPEADMTALNAAHLTLNDALRASGHLVDAEALQPARTTECVRLRNGKISVTDGPYAESKEMVAGFYVIEARDLTEATQIAARIPSASLGTVEVRPTRQLLV